MAEQRPFLSLVSIDPFGQVLEYSRTRVHGALNIGIQACINCSRQEPGALGQKRTNEKPRVDAKRWTSIL